MNQRTLYRWLGVALFVVGAGALTVVSPDEPALVAQMVLLAVAGALFAAAGLTDRVRWSFLVGVGDIVLGASLVLGGIADGDNVVYTGAVVLGGLSLAGIGVLYVLDHESLDIP